MRWLSVTGASCTCTATTSGFAPGWASPQLGESERELLARFIDTHERGDADEALELIADDIRVTMPPAPMLFEGREAVMGLMHQAFSPEASMGDWRLLPIQANRQPAAASYLRATGETEFRAFKIDVLRVVDGRIAEITTFGPGLFAAFGLGETL